MKLVVSMILLFLSVIPASAGGYYSGLSIDEYDKDTGLYFKSVRNGVKKGVFSKNTTSRNTTDINIFDPTTDQNIMVFNDTKNRMITNFFYESGYQVETGSIIFCAAEKHYGIDNHVKNNCNIEKRKLKDQLLIVVYNQENETSDFWRSNKLGRNLKKIKTLGANSDWHIDVKNSKIRFITFTVEGLKIQSLDW